MNLNESALSNFQLSTCNVLKRSTFKAVVRVGGVLYKGLGGVVLYVVQPVILFVYHFDPKGTPVLLEVLPFVEKSYPFHVCTSVCEHCTDLFSKPLR